MIFIVSQMAAGQSRQIKTTLQFIHIEAGNFLPAVEEGVRRGWCEEEHF